MIKAEKEPQSEAEEPRDDKDDFQRAVAKECKIFIQALENYEVVQIKDIADLTNMQRN